jgi:hypothetical protein
MKKEPMKAPWKKEEPKPMPKKKGKRGCVDLFWYLRA